MIKLKCINVMKIPEIIKIEFEKHEWRVKIITTNKHEEVEFLYILGCGK